MKNIREKFVMKDIEIEQLNEEIKTAYQVIATLKHRVTILEQHNITIKEQRQLQVDTPPVSVLSNGRFKSTTSVVFRPW